MGQQHPPTPIVLVVEDEPVQRLDMVDMVERAGFRVLECFDAAHAVAILEKRTDVRVVLADIDLPGTMNGLTLAAFVRDRWPPIELILTTAGRAPALGDLPARAAFIPKPINYDRAVELLRRMSAAG